MPFPAAPFARLSRPAAVTEHVPIAGDGSPARAFRLWSAPRRAPPTGRTRPRGVAYQEHALRRRSWITCSSALALRATARPLAARTAAARDVDLVPIGVLCSLCVCVCVCDVHVLFVCVLVRVLGYLSVCARACVFAYV